MARQAIARAIDRDALVQSAVHGAGRAQTIPIVARDAAWVPPADDLDLAYAPGTARELLDDAQAIPTLTLGAPEGDVGDTIAAAVIDDLDAIGVTVERDDDAPDLTVALRDPTDDPTAALAAYTCAGGDVFCDAQYEEAFARFSAASDPPTQQAAAHEMVRQLASEGVEVVLFAPDDVQAFRTDNVVGLLQPPGRGPARHDVAERRAVPRCSPGTRARVGESADEHVRRARDRRLRARGVGGRRCRGDPAAEFRAAGRPRRGTRCRR